MNRQILSANLCVLIMHLHMCAYVSRSLHIVTPPRHTHTDTHTDTHTESTAGMIAFDLAAELTFCVNCFLSCHHQSSSKEGAGLPMAPFYFLFWG